jgi:hypothetical protein
MQRHEIRYGSLIAVLVGLSILLAPLDSLADSVSSAQWNIQVDPGLFRTDQGCVSGPHAIACGDSSGPMVNIAGSLGGSSSAGVTYFFNIVGAAPGQFVPILITGAYDAHVFGAKAVVAGGIAVGQDPSRLSDIMNFRCTEADGDNCHLQFTLSSSATNTGNAILIRTGGASVAIDGTYTSWVDPIITIDPSFANASNYSILVSPDITQAAGNGPASSVPEPASLVLLGTGVIGVIGTMRQKLFQ